MFSLLWKCFKSNFSYINNEFDHPYHLALYSRRTPWASSFKRILQLNFNPLYKRHLQKLSEGSHNFYCGDERERPHKLLLCLLLFFYLHIQCPSCPMSQIMSLSTNVIWLNLTWPTVLKINGKKPLEALRYKIKSKGIACLFVCVRVCVHAHVR